MEQKIMIIPETRAVSESSEGIPDWIKNNAAWWAQGLIDDSDFVTGIQYLIERGIMVVDVEKTEQEFDVIIIGAGIAGLAAANELDSLGHDVVLLEARDRFGGRIWTDRSWNGIPLELEAHWIHGEIRNPVAKLAKEYGAKTIPFDYDSIIIYDTEGNEISEVKEGRMWETFQSFLQFIEVEREKIDYDVSLEQVLNKFIESKNLSEREGEELLFIVNTEIEHEYGADASNLSLFHFDIGSEEFGGDVIFPDGYDQIINGLAQGLDIRLEHVVNKVEYDDLGVRVITNQEAFKADYVISTLSLGVLMNGDVEFSPPLPERKIQAISKLGMGLVNKLYLLFPEVFWDDTNLIGYISESGKTFEILNVEKYTGENILLVFSQGEQARELEKLSDEDIVKEVMLVLRTMYGEDIPEPQDFLITRFGLDEFSRGAYSYTPVGATPDDYDALAEPVMNRVFFAGEATSKKYPATTNGAYLSGIREAERIHNLG